MNKCPKCESLYLYAKLKLIPTNKPAPYPKYVPMIGIYCSDKNHWIKWAKQTQETIDGVNQILNDDFVITNAQHME